MIILTNIIMCLTIDKLIRYLCCFNTTSASRNTKQKLEKYKNLKIF